MSLSAVASVRRLLLAPTQRPSWQESPRPLTQAAKGLALAVIVVAVLLPFWIVLSTSLSPLNEVNRGGGYTLWPDHPTLQAYRDITRSGLISHATVVSVLLVLIGTATSLACTILLAYALSRPNVVGRRLVLKCVLVAFLFPPGMIPSYLIVSQLHLVNNYSALVLPTVIDVFNLVVLRGFFQGLPTELYEAARLDGAGEARILLRIVLPLSRSVVAVVGFFYGVAYWNDYFKGLFYLSGADKWPLGTLLRMLVIGGNSPDSSGQSLATLQINAQADLMATIVVAVVPIALAYPFLQRFFSRGVLTGAVKS
ncbi:carbohydrate ABC transporter permease [Streptacidiphilus sp. MAP5-3]|uniref:carbohydrate ABC transporter permease n=1 Tax=unclassified Streptacidiphilus TaxID=2643834 RepID=UPI00351870F0